MTESYLVTGATGALGSAVAHRLHGEGKRLRVFIRNPDKFRRLLPDVAATTEIVVGDILDAAKMREVAEGARFIFHCVGFPLAQFERLPQSTENLLGAAPQGAHIVYPGNSHVFGIPQYSPVDAAHPHNPTCLVAQIKSQTDEMLLRAYGNRGIPTTVVHLPDFYGPRVTNQLMRSLFQDGLKGKTTRLPFPIDAPHQYIHVDDAARALIAVAGQEKAYGYAYTVPAVDSITLRDFSALIHGLAGTKGGMASLPSFFLSLAGLFSTEIRRAKGIMYTFTHTIVMDGAQMKADFGFTPEIGYEEGIEDTLEWFRTQFGRHRGL